MKMTLTVLLIASVLMFGCSKKDTPQPTGKPPAETDAPSTLDTVKEAAVEAIKESFTMDVDLEKTVADLKAEAAQMDIENLKEVAAKYKEALAAKETELKALVDKLSAVPLTEKLGKEAQGLTAEIKTLTDGVAALQERFQVYVDALTAKGADVKALLG
jgi:ABC-type transporter Mla subunit MlaD